MREYSIVYTRKAKEDIIDIGDYIAFTLMEPETAYRLVLGLQKVIMSLRELPNRFALVDDSVLASQGVHCVSYKNYYVFYEIEEEMSTVIVLRIGYNRRNWKDILLK